MSWRRSLPLVVAISFQIIGFAHPASAHASDEYGHNTLLSVTADGIHIDSQLTVGPLVGAQLIDLIDLDHNGLLTDAEVRKYGDTFVADLAVTVDGEMRPVTLVALLAPHIDDLRSGAAGLQLTAVAAGPAPAREFTFADNHRVLKGPAQASLLSEPNTPAAVEIVRDIERGIRVKGAYASSSPTTPATSTNESSTRTKSAATTQRTKTLQRFLGDAVSPWTMAVALGAAALLGALHALTPGHGKTIAAAYLIGERATTRHAVTLGLSTTVTHTSSVVVLGAMSLGFASFVDASALVNGLRIGSGLLIVGLGLALLYRRATGHPHGHVHTSDGHFHDGSSHDGHSHGHSHETEVVTDERISARRIIAMGATGGILPCPEALGLLILAVGAHRQAFGIAMILAFSVGLASVLVGIGIALVRARSVVQRFTALPPVLVQTWLPIASAIVVTALGLAILFGRVV